MAVEAERFVLSEYEDAAQIGVDAIGESDVDDAIHAAERNGGFGAIAGERPETFTLASGEKYPDGIAHIGHGVPPADA